MNFVISDFLLDGILLVETNHLVYLSAWRAPHSKGLRWDIWPAVSKKLRLADSHLNKLKWIFFRQINGYGRPTASQEPHKLGDGFPIARPHDAFSPVNSSVIAFVTDPELEDPAKTDPIPELQKLCVTRFYCF